MNRKELEHLIRAASAITNEYEIMVVGSQSILGSVPEAPDFLLSTMEADVFPLKRPDLAHLIDGAIGELSPFEENFGYYAHGVGPETVILPTGWETRIVKIQNENTDLRIGYCLEPHDLAASKLAAGREKDKQFVEAMLEHKIVEMTVVKERVRLLPIPEERKMTVVSWLVGRLEQQDKKRSSTGFKP
jgi:hypothetical protein